MIEQKKYDTKVFYIEEKVIESSTYDQILAENIVAPNLEKMGSDNFNSCPNLKSFYAPKLKEIGVDCFENCPALTIFDTKKLNEKGIVFLGSLLIDIKRKNILNYGTLEPKLVVEIEHELSKDAVRLITKDDKTQILKVGLFDVLKVENGFLTELCLPECKKLPAHSLYDNYTVQVLILPKAGTIDQKAIYKSEALQKLIAPHVREICAYNVLKCPKLEVVEMPELTKMSECCFSYNPKLKEISFKKLTNIDRLCCSNLPLVEEGYFQNLTSIGEASFQHNHNMRAIYCPLLLEMGKDVFHKSNIKHLYAPRLKRSEVVLSHLSNFADLLKNKGITLYGFDAKVKD